jgi:hypothetical protein
MRKNNVFIILLAMMTLAMTAAKFAAASFKWEETVHDFGRIPQGKPVTARFSFTNSGDSPLIIKNATGSCGCTNVTYPKDPVQPGQAGEVHATFNAEASGVFTKTVSVESNAAEGLTILTFKGEVVK